MPIPLDYPTLKIIWWILLGMLIIAFAIMDGFDLGIGMLLHRVAKTDNDRRVVLNSIGPTWEGNQIWLILGAGSIFAAWPDLYAVAFSGFYFAMLLVLLALILRPVGFKYRSKLANPAWRTLWDFCLFISGFVPTLVFGIAIGNVLQGVPYHFDTYLQSYYTGTLLQLFNPFALLCGLVSVFMLTMHGGIYLAIKTNGQIQRLASRYASISALLTIILFAIGGLWVSSHINGYVLINAIPFDEPANPLHKKVALQLGAWISNYFTYPGFIIAPLTGLLAPVATLILILLRCYRLAWVTSALTIICIIATVGLSMFPFILPSSTNPDMSLLVWDASSSQTTLFIMLFVSAIFIPLIILYTSWVYYVMRGKVTNESVKETKGSY